MSDEKKPHGGDRRSLDGGGVTRPFAARLGEAAQGRLDELAARAGLDRAEVLRRLLLHPDALEHVTRE